ncbi:MAG TPA: hypothetical protein VMT30_00110 [Candidatus Saccharimonadia bacterium]|nr:hypothetical protein [Candidatus Saccharimonadia bacterium]
MRRRKPVLTVAAIAVALLLGGCGANSTNPPRNTSTTLGTMTRIYLYTPVTSDPTQPIPEEINPPDLHWYDHPGPTEAYVLQHLTALVNTGRHNIQRVDTTWCSMNHGPVWLAAAIVWYTPDNGAGNRVRLKIVKSDPAQALASAHAAKDTTVLKTNRVDDNTVEIFSQPKAAG